MPVGGPERRAGVKSGGRAGRVERAWWARFRSPINGGECHKSERRSGRESP